MCCKLLFFRNALWATNFNPESTIVLWKHIIACMLELTNESPSDYNNTQEKFWNKVSKSWVLTDFSVLHKLQHHLHWWFLTFSDLQCNCKKAERGNQSLWTRQCKKEWVTSFQTHLMFKAIPSHTSCSYQLKKKYSKGSKIECDGEEIMNEWGPWSMMGSPGFIFS